MEKQIKLTCLVHLFVIIFISSSLNIHAMTPVMYEDRQGMYVWVYGRIIDKNSYKENETYITSCFDSIKNNDETDIDCGGSCARCNDGQQCNTGSDCKSAFDDWTREGESFMGTCTNSICGRALGEACIVHGTDFHCAEGYCTPLDFIEGNKLSVCCNTNESPGECQSCEGGYIHTQEDGTTCYYDGDPIGQCIRGTCVKEK